MNSEQAKKQLVRAKMKLSNAKIIAEGYKSNIERLQDEVDELIVKVATIELCYVGVPISMTNPSSPNLTMSNRFGDMASADPISELIECLVCMFDTSRPSVGEDDRSRLRSALEPFIKKIE